MKTVAQINEEIRRLAVELKEATDSNERRKAGGLQRQIDQLKFYRLYLETRPREETVEKMRSEVIRSIDILEKRFDTWLAGQPVKGDRNAMQARYYAQAGIPELKSRLKALNYLCEK